jgi:exonuclease VII small subunit
MRRMTISIFLMAFALTLCVVAKDEAVGELKSRVESARPEDRPGLCIQIAQQQLLNADRLYTDGQVEQARAALDDIVTYSEKARDSAARTKKHLKNVEIAVRKISEKLRDIKRTLAFEDQPPVDQAIKRLEDIRTALLKEMFSKEKK